MTRTCTLCGWQGRRFNLEGEDLRCKCGGHLTEKRERYVGSWAYCEPDDTSYLNDGAITAEAALVILEAFNDLGTTRGIA